MAGSGWPIFAEWAERDAARKALPQYGGNSIPDSYLDRFNAATEAWLVRIGARPATPPDQAELPADIADFARLL